MKKMPSLMAGAGKIARGFYGMTVAVIHPAVQKRTDPYFESPQEIFMVLRNQQWEVFAGRRVTHEGRNHANPFCKKLHMDDPDSFKRQKDPWVIRGTILSPQDGKKRLQNLPGIQDETRNIYLSYL